MMLFLIIHYSHICFYLSLCLIAIFHLYLHLILIKGMDRKGKRIKSTVCAQSNVFCSEPPKGGGVSSERNESSVR